MKQQGGVAEEGWWTEKRVAAYLMVSERTVRRWADVGKLPQPQYFGRYRRYKAEEVRNAARKMPATRKEKKKTPDVLGSN